MPPLCAEAVAATVSLPPRRSRPAGSSVSLGLTGGGVIFAVLLLVCWLGVDPQTAVSISLVTVAVTPLVGAVARWWYGQLE